MMYGDYMSHEIPLSVDNGSARLMVLPGSHLWLATLYTMYSRLYSIHTVHLSYLTNCDSFIAEVLHHGSKCLRRH